MLYYSPFPQANIGPGRKIFSGEICQLCVLCNIYFVLWHVDNYRLLLSLNVLNSLQLKATYVVILIQVKSLMHETEYIIDCIHVSRVMFLCGGGRCLCGSCGAR